MNGDLEVVYENRFNVDLGSLTESEKRVVQCFVERIHISRNNKRGSQTKLLFGERLANKVAIVGGS